MFEPSNRNPASGRESWQLNELHAFSCLERLLLLDVRSGRSFEIDEPGAAFVEASRGPGGLETAAAVVKNRWGRLKLARVWDGLRRQGLLTRNPSPRPLPPDSPLEPITSLDLNVTHRCNLACRYCYGAYGDLLSHTDQQVRYGSERAWMSREVAEQAFDFLLRESGNSRQLSVIFFGGEPLLNFRLIRVLVPLFKEKARQAGKTVNMSTATNATLLTDKALKFLVDNEIGIQFSFDGPAAVQDDQRRDRKDGGTYARVIKAAQRLFAFRPNAITARATLTRQHLCLREIVEHLLQLGFENVHVEPATGVDNEYSVTIDCLPDLLRQYEQMAALFLEWIEKGDLLNFSNFVKYIRSTKNPTAARFYPCGAGRGYVCADPSGKLYLCHRFTGMEEYALGDVFQGIDNRVRDEINRLHVDVRSACSACWARYFCGGGCWRVNVGGSGTLEKPDEEFSCVLQRRIIELSIGINAHLADDEAQLLADRYSESRLPYE